MREESFVNGLMLGAAIIFVIGIAFLGTGCDDAVIFEDATPRSSLAGVWTRTNPDHGDCPGVTTWYTLELQEYDFTARSSAGLVVSRGSWLQQTTANPDNPVPEAVLTPEPGTERAYLTSGMPTTMGGLITVDTPSGPCSYPLSLGR